MGISSAVLHPGRLDEAAGRAAIRVNWFLIAAGALLLVASARFSGFAWDLSSLLPVVGLNAAMLGIAFMLNARGHAAPAQLFHAIAQIAYCSMVGSLLSVVLAGTAAPMRDAGLIELDRWIGFDWRMLLGAMPEWPRLTLSLNYAYASLSYQPLPLLLLLAAVGQVPRANVLALAWTLTLAITIAIFPFVPALGGYLHYGIARAEVPQVLIPAAWLYADVFEGARSGVLRVLGSHTLDGVITFPSFHAAAAVLLAWGFYGVPWLRWPGVALNALMIASTPIVGGHYLADVLAGMAVAAAGIVGAKRLGSSFIASVNAAPTTRVRAAVAAVNPKSWGARPRNARSETIYPRRN